MNTDPAIEQLWKLLGERDGEVEQLRAVNAQLLAVMRVIQLNVRDPDRLTHTQAVFKLEMIELEASKAIKEAEAWE